MDADVIVLTLTVPIVIGISGALAHMSWQQCYRGRLLAASNLSASAAAHSARLATGARIARQSESQVARPLAWVASFISWSVASFT
jgi:hypothetical protein